MQQFFTAVSKLKSYFPKYKNDVAAAMAALNAVSEMLERHEAEFAQALAADLGKSYFESYLTEIGLLKEEIKYFKRHLSKWRKNKKIPISLSQFPARMEVQREAYGLCLLITPWNYPLQLSLTPLIACLAAGNVAVLKLSADSANLQSLLAVLLAQYLPDTVYLVPPELSKEVLWEIKYDYIFFTGSAAVGKEIMQLAAKNLTPVSLELGGKSPAIVTPNADIELAAKNIAFGKILNSGQTCVAPDYVIVHEEAAAALKDALIKEFAKINEQAAYMLNSQVKIVNLRQLKRLENLLAGHKVIYGGKVDEDSLHMDFTLIEVEAGDQSPLMQTEIFGPLLPIVTYKDFSALLERQAALPKPLALYLFSQDKVEIASVQKALSAGSMCINDTILQIVSPHAPFGGVGDSGMGAYHGYYGFETFTHAKTVLHKGHFINLPWRYPPFKDKYLPLLKFFLG